MVLRLLHACPRRFVVSLRLDHRYREVPRVLEEVVRSLLRTTVSLRARDYDPAVCERPLLRNERGGASQPASRSLGTTYFRQVSASLLI
jgi:hypothetical protein